MSKLRVDFQEGFAADEVEIRINGHDSFHKEGVTTRRMLGLATSSEIEVPDGPVDIEIEVPTRRLSKTISLKSSESAHLGVSIQGGELKLMVSQKPFGYA
jgi:hypothetical protein